MQKNNYLGVRVCTKSCTLDNKKIDEATKLINLAINDYDLFLKEINNYNPEKKAEALSWLRNALKYVNKKQTEK